jgi:hypothetical protein
VEEERPMSKLQDADIRSFSALGESLYSSKMSKLVTPRDNKVTKTAISVIHQLRKDLKTKEKETMNQRQQIIKLKTQLFETTSLAQCQKDELAI